MLVVVEDTCNKEEEGSRLKVVGSTFRAIDS